VWSLVSVVSPDIVRSLFIVGSLGNEEFSQCVESDIVGSLCSLGSQSSV
jgi:hypothetical protein